MFTWSSNRRKDPKQHILEADMGGLKCRGERRNIRGFRWMESDARSEMPGQVIPYASNSKPGQQGSCGTSRESGWTESETGDDAPKRQRP